MKRPVSLQTIPGRPGVYLMRDKNGEILYIGKAKNLKKRVFSYFQKGVLDSKTATLVRNISSVETFITDNEVEALILESNLIKQYKPRYNIELKENESYPYIKITNENFPRILKTRNRIEDGALYFGPYTNASYVNRTIRTITEIFPIRRCGINLDKKKPSNPCINYYLGKCICPCCGKITHEEYAQLVDQVVLFLKGQNQVLLSFVKNEMQKEANNRRYEQALYLRDRLRALEHLMEEQKMTTGAGENEDFIGIARGNSGYTIAVLVKRNGKMVGKRDYTIKQKESPPKVLEQFLPIHYDGSTPAPRVLFLPFEVPHLEVINSYLEKTYSRPIRTMVPKRGIKKRLVDLACRNAEQSSREQYPPDPYQGMERLKNVLQLRSIPHCIEAFDIATTLGTYSVAGMVRFTSGVPDRKSYRRYRIRFTPGQNDVEMIREAVARRYQRLLNEKKELPDLILVDGGIQQVQGAGTVLDALDIHTIPVVGLAKKHEDIYVEEKGSPISLKKNDPALRLLMSIRDEVHRYANLYHTTIRAKEMLVSRLSQIPGIGDRLVSAVLTALDTNVEKLDIDYLQGIRGIGPEKASRILQALRGSGITAQSER